MADVDQALRAIASPERRAMLKLVWSRERSSSDIAARLGLSRPAASQHLRVLRDAGLVRVRPVGTRRLYSVEDKTIRRLRAFLESFWSGRLQTLKREAERLHRRGG